MIRENKNEALSKSIQDKNLEVHYNEKIVKTKDGLIKLELQGKIRCPVINQNISSLTCSNLMGKPDWPRGIDEKICTKCNCFIQLSIKNFQSKKKDK